ncbi:MAG: hypothetical protein K6D02_08160 [Lachnospiraceae bacterium]|nr:hypothetical protein [Lachnospiraceae bacterium]
MRKSKLVKSMVACLTATSVVVTATAVNVHDNVALAAKNKASKEKTIVKAASTSEEVTKKHETVYAVVDYDGGVKELNVSDWIQYPGEGSLSDESDLKDIENIKGEETFKQSGDSLTWESKGEDIYYTGKSDKDLPVGMSMNFYLDGDKIEAKDLEGKSGELEIDIKYNNYADDKIEVGGKNVTAYVPFLMVTGMILPVENFKNITIDNGKVLSEGDNSIVVAYGLPGLKDSLDLGAFDLSDFNMDLNKVTDKLTDTVTIKADVEDFQMNETYTYASNDFFSDMDLEEVDDGEELFDKLDELTGAVDKLVNGSKKLSDGADTLENSFSDYSDGIDALRDGAGDLADGASDLNDGVDEYTTGNVKLLKGVKKYAKGSKTLAKGAKKYAKNTKKVVDGIKTVSDGSLTLAEGSKEFETNLTTFSTTINKSLDSSSLTTLADSIDKLHSGIVALQSGMSDFSDGVKKLDSGLDSISSGADSLMEGNNKMKSAVDQVEEAVGGDNGVINAAKQLEAGAGQVSSGISNINSSTKNLTQYDSDVDSYVETLTDLYKAALQDGDNDKAESIKAIITYVKTAKQVADGISEGTDESSSLYTGSQAVAGGITKAKDGLTVMDSTLKQVSSGLSSSNDGLTQIKNGVSTIQGENGIAKMSAGISQMEAGLSEMEEKTKDTSKITEAGAGFDLIKAAATKLDTAYKTELHPGIAKLSSGAAVLYSKSKLLVDSNLELNKGANSIIKNSKTIKKNSNKLIKASPELLSGSNKLLNGTNELLTGVTTIDESTDLVSDGISDLSDGADTLSNGLKRFKKSGVDKLTGSLDDIIDTTDDFKQRIEGVSELSKDYKSFSGISEDMEGNCKFIIKTEPIGGEE